MIDNNGYIVISENLNDTGRFFGKVNSPVMRALVENGTFQEIVVYDWQALCSEMLEVSSDANLMLTPFRMILLGVKLLLGHLFWTFSRVHSYLGVLGQAYEDYAELGSEGPTQRPKTLRKGQNQEEEDYFNRNQTPSYEPDYFACDKRYTLYDLDEANLLKNDGLDRMPTNTSTTYFLRRINNSNLLLLAVDGRDPGEPMDQMTTDGIVIGYNDTFPCHKLEMNSLERRRLDECFTTHDEEADVHYCGTGVRSLVNWGLLVLLVGLLGTLF